MYVDSVYIKHFQEVAQLISPMTTAPMSGCLSFYYQLQQGNDNVFSLYSRDVTGLYEEIWKTNSPGNPAWNLAEVEFSAPYPMEVGVPLGPVLATMQGTAHTEMEVRRCYSLTLILLGCISVFFLSSLSRPPPLLSLLCIPVCLPPLSPSFSNTTIFSKDGYGKVCHQLDLGGGGEGLSSGCFLVVPSARLMWSFREGGVGSWFLSCHVY